MKSFNAGTSTSTAEVINISANGIWLLVCDKEYFLSFEDFPWFKSSTIDNIIDVQLVHDKHLHWKKLDVDLTIESLDNLEKYPLIYK